MRETAGKEGPLSIGVRGCERAIRTDLLERDLGELQIVNGVVHLDLRANGYGAVGLIPLRPEP